MAKDIALNWDTVLMGGDITILNGDIKTDSGFETAVLISLYTDRRAKDDDQLLDSRNQDKRGWWGDLLKPDEEGDQIGSRLWLLSREKTLDSVLKKVDSYIKESLQWMIKDNIITKIETEVERQTPTQENNILAFTINLYKVDGREVALKYSYQWDEV